VRYGAWRKVRSGLGRDGMKTREDVRIQDRVGGRSFDGAASRPSRSLPGHATELHLDDEAGNRLGYARRMVEGFEEGG